MMNIPVRGHAAFFFPTTFAAPLQVGGVVLGMLIAAGVCLLSPPPGAGVGRAASPLATTRGTADFAGDRLVVTREGGDVVIRDGAGALLGRRAAVAPGRLDLDATTSVTFTGNVAWPCGELIVHAARVVVDGGSVAARRIDLDAAEGLRIAGSVVAGLVHLEGRQVVLDDGAVVDASGDAGGGRITVGAADLGTQLVVIGQRAQVRADALASGRGGRITITAAKLIQAGRLSVDGLRGDGGDIVLALGEHGIQVDAGALSARGASQGGGIVVGGVDGSAGGSAGAPGWFLSGTLDASAGVGSGGSVTILGAALELAATRIDASGDAGGGTVAIGGAAHGGDQPAADTVAITAAAHIACDARQRGDGGRVSVWSTVRTQARGGISARGGALAGAGGAIELSSAGAVSAAGAADAGAAQGAPGRLLLDPKNIVISDAGATAPQFELSDPHPGAGNEFGMVVRTLSTGNIVVTAPGDTLGGTNAGAVYLFNGRSGALLAALVGGTAGDDVGGGIYGTDGGIWVLANGNYVVTTPSWDAGAVVDAGAVTWCDGRTGRSGLVNAGNSLVGGTAGDLVGSDGVLALANGNYVVASSTWSRDGVLRVGAVTWCSGAGGRVGAITAANSLVGSATEDHVGYHYQGPSLFALANGNYVVRSPYWKFDTSGAPGAGVTSGAVTWGDGTVGTVGEVSAANSLVGAGPGDAVGASGIDVLSNGNYVVNSEYWQLSGVGSVGAVTWASGSGGTVGVVDASNSLIGGHVGDAIGGGGGIIHLTNGNFVVQSNHWTNGVPENMGAVTWCSGTAPTVGTVNAANSLVGSVSEDSLGRTVIPLAHGDYVVSSVNWHNGQPTNVGAVTWCDGAVGTRGVISDANSLVGTPGNDIGNIVVPLANGAAVLCSPYWKNGAISGAGAVTLLSPHQLGTISAANSLVGTSTNDLVGYGITALTNGNFVIDSANWHDANGNVVGAVTWCDGSSGRVGTVGPGNSLVGTQPNGGVGVGGLGPDNGLLALPNGNYVVTSYNWTDGAKVSVGAVTWGDGRSGVVGTVTSANSLIGATAGDHLGFGGAHALPNGNYVVNSRLWQDQSGAAVGAWTWGDGARGTAGVVGPANSLVGSHEEDLLEGDITTLANGDFAISNPAWDDGATTDVGAVTWVDGASGRSLTGFGRIGRGNSVVGTAPMSGVGSVPPNIIGYRAWNSVKTPQDDAVDGQVPVGFPSDGGGHVRVLVTSPGAFTYASAPAATVTVPTDFLTRALAAGTAVTLQASNDLTVASPVLVDAASGTAGALTLQAGRSLALGANIVTGNAALTLIANDDAASGVVDAQRDPGAATITMAASTSISAGNGAVNVTLRPGTGKTNRASGQVALGSISARTLNVVNAGVSAGSGITQTGTWTIHGGGALSAGANPIDLQGTVDLGTGTLTSGPGTTRIAGTLAIALDGSGAGLLDLSAATGPAVMALPTLSFSASVTVPVGTHLTLVRNAGVAPSGGMFAGLVSNSSVTGGGQTFRLSYSGGPHAQDIALDKGGPPLITWAQPAPIAEGTALSGVQLGATASVPGTFTYSPAVGTVLPAGVTRLYATFQPANPLLFATVDVSTPLTVYAVGEPLNPRFGSSVSISGDELAALGGAATRVFVRTGGSWSLQAALPVRGDEVVIAGSRLAVGHAAGENGLGSGSGVALFAFDGTAWKADGEIPTVASPELRGPLHSVIALSGDTLAIGGVDAYATTNASVDIYQRGPGGWALVQQLTQAQTDTDLTDYGLLHHFGSAVALQGDTLIVGAPGFSAFAYSRVAGTWISQGQLLQPWITTGTMPYLSGWSVALDGDLAVVGSVGGPVETFRRGAAGWTYDAEISTTGFGVFGYALRAANGTVAIFSLMNGTATGRTDFFTEVQLHNWQVQPGVSTPNATNTFGDDHSPFGLDGSTFVCGAPLTPGAGGVQAGEVDVYGRSGTAWTLQTRLTATTPITIDIGTARPALGGASGDSTAFTIAAGGTGIGGTADDFRFLPLSLPGDGEITARVSLTSTQAGAKAGIMLRDGSAAGARNVLLALSRPSGLVLQWRSQTDGATQAQVPAAGLTGPVWLRLVRHGDTVVASYSQDGASWTAAGQAVVQLPRPTAAGAAVCGASTTVASSGSFTSLVTTPYTLGQPLNLATAFGAALAGSGAETNAGLTTVAGGGTIIGDVASDGGEFLASAPLPGDFDFHAQVQYQRGTDGNAQAGLMLRAGSAADAPDLFLFLTPSHGGKVQRRSVAGGPTAFLARTNNTAPWFRITRTGSQVATFWSLDGAAWTPLATATITGPLNVGLAVCGANPALLGVATFANVALTSPDPAPLVTVAAVGAITNAGVIPFTLTFSSPVTGLSSSAIIVVDGVAGALTGSGAVYTVPITPSGDGLVTVTVPANAAVTAAGRGNLAGTGSITSDRTAPVPTITPNGTTFTTSPITFAIAFSEPVTGLSSGAFSISNATLGALVDSGTHDRYTLLATPIGSGAVGMTLLAGSAHDAAGNVNLQATASVISAVPQLPAAIDIGTARPALGGVTGSGDAFTIAAGGTGIGGTADDFRFLPVSLPGDGEITARVSLTSTQAGAKAGIMLRDGSAAGARNVLLALSRPSGLVLQWRSQTDGATQAQVPAAGLTGPVWLRLVRHGDTVVASYSQDGASWTAAGQAVVQLPRPTAAGAAVCGASTTVASSGSFTSLVTTPYTLGQPLNLATAFGAALAGSGAETNAGLTTVAGGGTIIGDVASDGGEFLASAPLPGDFDFHAQVQYQRGTDGNAQAGLMLRAGTAVDAPNLFLFLTPSHGGKVQRRSVAGGPTAFLARTNNTAPWFRITRTGSQVATFSSLDGATWTPLATATITGPLNVGLAVCGANPALLGVATFANVALTSPDLAPEIPRGIN